MANSLTDLNGVVISEIALQAAAPKTAIISKFSTRFENVLKKNQTVNVPLYTASTTLENPTSFNVADASSVTRAVTPVHLYQPITISWTEFQEGHNIENQVQGAVKALVSKIQSKVFSVLSSSNYSVGLSANPSSLSADNLATLFASAVGEANCYLTRAAYSKFVPQNTLGFPKGAPAFGFDSFDYVDSFTGAQSGVFGFVSDPAGIAIATGLPELNGNVEAMEIDLGNGVRGYVTKFYDPITRTDVIGIETMLGVAVGDTNALKLAKQ